VLKNHRGAVNENAKTDSIISKKKCYNGIFMRKKVGWEREKHYGSFITAGGKNTI